MPTYIKNLNIFHFFLILFIFLFINVYADLQSCSERYADLKIYLGRQKFAAVLDIELKGLTSSLLCLFSANFYVKTNRQIFYPNLFNRINRILIEFNRTLIETNQTLIETNPVRASRAENRVTADTLSTNTTRVFAGVFEWIEIRTTVFPVLTAHLTLRFACLS